jgi:hypothetical protein
MPVNEIKLKIVIDGKEAISSISLTNDEFKKLVTSIRQASDESRNSGEQIVHSFAQARNLIQGLKETFSLFAATFQSHITSYQQQETALVKLNTALKQKSQFRDYNLKSNAPAPFVLVTSSLTDSHAMYQPDVGNLCGLKNSLLLPPC